MVNNIISYINILKLFWLTAPLISLSNHHQQRPRSLYVAVLQLLDQGIGHLWQASLGSAIGHVARGASTLHLGRRLTTALGTEQRYLSTVECCETINMQTLHMQ